MPGGFPIATSRILTVKMGICLPCKVSSQIPDAGPGRRVRGSPHVPPPCCVTVPSLCFHPAPSNRPFGLQVLKMGPTRPCVRSGGTILGPLGPDRASAHTGTAG